MALLGSNYAVGGAGLISQATAAAAGGAGAAGAGVVAGMPQVSAGFRRFRYQNQLNPQQQQFNWS